MPPTTGSMPDRFSGNPATFLPSRLDSWRAIMSILPKGLEMLSPPAKVQISSVPVMCPQ